MTAAVPSNTIATVDNFEELLDARRLKVRTGPADWWTLERSGASLGVPGPGGWFRIPVRVKEVEFTVTPDYFCSHGMLDRDHFMVFESLH